VATVFTAGRKELRVCVAVFSKVYRDPSVIEAPIYLSIALQNRSQQLRLQTFLFQIKMKGKQKSLHILSFY